MKRARLLFAMTLATILLCVVSYFWIDRPVAIFAYQHHLRQYPIFYAMQWFPALFVYLGALALLNYCVQFLRDRVGPHARVWAIITVAFIVAETITDQLKMVFGRFWTATWVNHNPSFLNDGAYGFHWFTKGDAYRSFPSGHTVAVFSVMTLVAMFYPRARWLSVLACLSVVTGLLADYYHFVGDIIAGAYLGTVVALFFGWSFPSFRFPLPLPAGEG